MILKPDSQPFDKIGGSVGEPSPHSLQILSSLGPVSLHQANDLIPAVEPRQVAGGIPVVVPMPHVAGGVLHKELHHLEVAFFGSQVQGQIPFVILDVNISLKLQQSL